MIRIAARLRLALFIALAGWCGFFAPVEAREPRSPVAIEQVALADLPPEAAQTLRLIRSGGPFPYPHKDGSIFGNFEKQLPAQPRGYYREYTVPTPGARDRGARRIVTGGNPPEVFYYTAEYYYTPNHYRSFARIRER